MSPWAFSTISRGYGIERHGLKPHDDLERTFAHSLALLKNVGELGNIQQLSPISLVSDHVVPQIHLEEAVNALGLSIGLRMEAY